MPRGKRSPIDYTPQFAEGIFRPKEIVDTERDAVTGRPAAEAPPQKPVRTARTNERTVERTQERSRVRHSFDVWQDQLLALAEIQAETFGKTGRKPKMGELVQEALDAYIATRRTRMNERSNERTAT